MTSTPSVRRGFEGVLVPLAFTGDEAALVDALRAKHPGAMAAFFQRYVKLVERLITHVLGFDSELPDVLQEVFAAALSSIHSLHDPAALEPWLASVAALTARKVLRTRSRRAWLRRFTDTAEDDLYEPVAPGVDVAARRALRGVYSALSKLPTDERIAFALRFIDGMELTEVAGACNVSLATIKRRLTRAERRFLANARNHPELAVWIGGSRWQDR
jgi:RNA polymerase sigma-70 factor, ECF subfamily